MEGAGVMVTAKRIARAFWSLLFLLVLQATILIVVQHKPGEPRWLAFVAFGVVDLLQLAFCIYTYRELLHIEQIIKMRDQIVRSISDFGHHQ